LKDRSVCCCKKWKKQKDWKIELEVSNDEKRKTKMKDKGNLNDKITEV